MSPVRVFIGMAFLIDMRMSFFFVARSFNSIKIDLNQDYVRLPMHFVTLFPFSQGVRVYTCSVVIGPCVMFYGIP